MSTETINANYAQMITAYGPPDADYEFIQAQYMNIRMSNIGSENINSFDYSNVVIGNSMFSQAGFVTFPAVDFASATSMSGAWAQCPNLTSFSEIQIPNVTNLTSAWQYCSNLVDFPANQFDTTGTLVSTAFSNSWIACALNVASIENILTSLDTNGQSNITLTIDGGTNAGKSTWTTAANTAYDSLIAKGWSITFNA